MKNEVTECGIRLKWKGQVRYRDPRVSIRGFRSTEKEDITW